MTDTFEKTYTNWSIDVGNYTYEGITLNEVEQNLYAIEDQEQDFLIVSPSNAILIDKKQYNFVQVCCDEDTDLLHIEFSVTNDGDQGAILYGKNELGPQEVLRIIENFIAHHKVPALDSWEIVLDLRPNTESL
ncbi:MAG: bacteriocin [Veillonella sp.]|uniref:bacteriocin n=1 Tax=Veillonella TaxID=29465 RepID=UPI001D075067|nr:MULTISPECIES: bacteriocin [Veillonella]MCB6804326.1 bacteriocin [Veillonella parvula]MCQ4926614.1 bacteriocin [Veillonella parvula]MCQ4957803.1 bacteriocin [Veillonella parvula]MDU7911560.1 bacteriocin [Veillonella parvula]MDU7927381.1 bacteriocin [Veillonella sp.]